MAFLKYVCFMVVVVAELSGGGTALPEGGKGKRSAPEMALNPKDPAVVGLARAVIFDAFLSHGVKLKYVKVAEAIFLRNGRYELASFAEDAAGVLDVYEAEIRVSNFTKSN